MKLLLYRSNGFFKPDFRVEGSGRQRMANALRLGIIGLGRGFMLTLPALKADSRVALAGAFDLRREARERFADEFGAPAFDTLDALLYSPVIDAVYIATPHELHAEQAIAALRAGSMCWSKSRWRQRLQIARV